MHDVHTPDDFHQTVTRVYAEEIITAFNDQMAEAARLVRELHNLLGDYATFSDHANPLAQDPDLMRWVEQYRRGLATAGGILHDGDEWLDRLNAPSQLGVPQSKTMLQGKVRALPVAERHAVVR